MKREVLKHGVSVVVLSGALLLVGCSTTVPGTAVMDPSAAPRPVTGNFATVPRTVAPITDAQATAAEGYRMVETIPLPPDVDPTIRYGGRITAGRPSVKSAIGDGVGTVLEGQEVGAYISATSKNPGASSSEPSKTLLMGVFRMKDAAAADAAVANPAILAAEKPTFSDSEPAKVKVIIPGYADATAYTKNWTTINTVSTVAVLARGQFVMAIYSTAGIGSVAKFLDLQIKALNGFKPTPVDRFKSLPKDRDDMLRYTLPVTGNRDVTLPARAAVVNQNDITGSVKNFADAGVDLEARAGNQVYRTKDAAGATLLAGRFTDETKGFYTGATESKVTGVPGGRCLNYPAYQGAKATTTYCVVPVGRYLAEVSDSQDARAKQGLGAAYLILQSAK